MRTLPATRRPTHGLDAVADPELGRRRSLDAPVYPGFGPSQASEARTPETCELLKWDLDRRRRVPLFSRKVVTPRTMIPTSGPTGPLVRPALRSPRGPVDTSLLTFIPHGY